MSRAYVYAHWSNLLRMRHAYFILFACLARYYRPTWRMINIKWQRQCTLPTIQKQSVAPVPHSPFPPPDFHLLLSVNLAFQLINIICWHITRSPVRRGAYLRLRNTLTSVTGIFAFYLHTFYDTCIECYRCAIIVRMRDSHLLLASSFTLYRDPMGTCCCWVFNVFDWSWNWRRTVLNVWQSVSYCARVYVIYVCVCLWVLGKSETKTNWHKMHKSSDCSDWSTKALNNLGCLSTFNT